MAGDQSVRVEGQPVAGKRAQDLKGYMKFNPGETRTLLVKHANGDQFDARITRAKE